MTHSEALEVRLADRLNEKLAESIVIYDLRPLTSIADFFVICTARSTVHAQSLAHELVEGMRIKSVGVEGLEYGHWVLIDFETVVVHIFCPEERSRYDLDGLWADAPHTIVSKELSTVNCR